MARRRKGKGNPNRWVFGLGAAAFVIAVFVAGIWAGMQFRDRSEAQKPADAMLAHRGSEVSAPTTEQRAELDRLVARVAEPEARPKPQVEPKLPAVALLRPNVPAWVQNAVISNPDPDLPMIALVIDDVGIDRRRSDAIAGLPGPLTLSYLTYARDLPDQTALARANGHEIMVHVPMQPKSADADPGPNVLRVRDSRSELSRKLDWGLSRFGGFVGVNNHMGSRFTQDRAGMDTVMSALAARGLFFLDSVTAPDSAGFAAAHAAGVPVLKRDVFLDNEDTPEEVRFRLEQTERIARRTGADRKSVV